MIGVTLKVVGNRPEDLGYFLTYLDSLPCS